MQARVSPLCNARRSSVPSAQHHSLTGITLGTKNWYGILGRQHAHSANTFTRALSTSPTSFVPTLTLVDSCRVLLGNGSTGGNLEDVRLKKTLVAGIDPVALDA